MDFEKPVKQKEKLQVKHALILILGSSLLLWTLIFSGMHFYKHIMQKRAQDERYKIVGLYQKCSSTETLPTMYLAELLSLSSDRPTNLYAFSTKNAEKKLRSLALFKYAKVRAAKPGVVYVEYELRRPVAQICDFENIAISEDKYLFPLTPFYTPKNLPEIYIGTNVQDALDPKSIELAFELMEFAKKTFPSTYSLKRIDLAKALILSANREIVLGIEERQGSKAPPKLFLVRLLTKNYQNSLKDFFALGTTFEELTKKEPSSTQVVDLRVDHIALVKSVTRNV